MVMKGISVQQQTQLPSRTWDCMVTSCVDLNLGLVVPP